MDSSDYEILIRNGLISIPSSSGVVRNMPNASIVTVLNNIAYYGFGLSILAYEKLLNLDENKLIIWWQNHESILRKITGDDKQIQKFVVYKNFPQEVLKMSEVEYWSRQILMYWGFPNDYFTETESEKPPLDDKLNYRILQLAVDNSLGKIFTNLLYLSNRWTQQQEADIFYLLPQFIDSINTDKINFKENLIKVLKFCFAQEINIKITSATDVLRFCFELSDGDVSLRKNTKFRNFKRKERKFILSLLNDCPHLLEDIYRRKNVWKKLMFALHPGDYKKDFPNVVKAYDNLYKDVKVTTFNSQLELLLENKDVKVLDLLKTRPGEFLRRLKTCINLFLQVTVNTFSQVIPKLTLIQLLKIHKYLETVNNRNYRTIPPKGNWTKMLVIEVEKYPSISLDLQQQLLSSIELEIKTRINPIVPLVNLDPQIAFVKIQDNNSQLTNYGRGTIFPIPDNITFIRTASYWRSGATHSNIWYDNGWNFFDEHWQPKGTCCWDYPQYTNNSAIFSGDPTNSKDIEGNACQLIDLYLHKLLEANVRYAVWNILCYSHLSFNVAEEVYGALQWGEKPMKGKLFEPSRCQLSFPIKGDNFTKYIALIDLYKYQLIYLDANLYGRVNSAAANSEKLAKNMPPFLEYLNSLPSVFDIFKHQKLSETGLHIAYSDDKLTLNGETAYIFKPQNKLNNFMPFNLTEILNN